MKAYIGIGSNLGNLDENIKNAISLLSKHSKILKVSNFIKTKPMYYLDQNDFLNGALLIDTHLGPRELLAVLQMIEKTMKREKFIDKGPRIIDLDILFYENDLINEKDLVVPHIGISERDFVLVPMSEIAPDFIHPKLKKTMKKLFDELPVK